MLLTKGMEGEQTGSEDCTLEGYVECIVSFGYPTSHLPDCCRRWNLCRDGELFFIHRDMSIELLKQIFSCFNVDIDPDEMEISFIKYDEAMTYQTRMTLYGEKMEAMTLGDVRFVKESNCARMIISKRDKADLFGCGSHSKRGKCELDDDQILLLRNELEKSWIGRLLLFEEEVEQFLLMQQKVWEKKKSYYYEQLKNPRPCLNRYSEYISVRLLIRGMEERRWMFDLQKREIIGDFLSNVDW